VTRNSFPSCGNTRPRKLSLPGPSVNWFVAQVRDEKDSSPVATLFELYFSPFFYESEKLLTGRECDGPLRRRDFFEDRVR
jgi:hypothetical protein